MPQPETPHPAIKRIRFEPGPDTGLRPDVEVALRAALEEVLEYLDQGPRVRQTVIENSLRDQAAGCRHGTVIRALELVLDQVQAAFPASPDPAEQDTCPECGQPPKVVSRTAAGDRFWWRCREGHQWETQPVVAAPDPAPIPQLSAADAKTAGQIADYLTGARWLKGVEWVYEGECPECRGYSAETGESEGFEVILAGHKAGCPLAAAARCFGLGLLMRPLGALEEDPHA